MSEMNVNGIVLDDAITKQLAELQDDYARILSDGLGEIMSFILEDCLIHCRNEEKMMLGYIQTLHGTQKALLNLVPKRKGGEQ